MATTVAPRRWPRLRFEPLSCATLAIAGLVALPVLVVIGHVFLPWGAIWAHLAATVLGDYVTTTLGLMAGVALGVVVIGLGCAWLVVMCEFPGRSWFEWALVLPMAVPGYVIAYTYADLLQFAGPVQTWIRDLTGWLRGDYWFPPVRSPGGAIALLTLVLYPYVYLLARAAFLQQSAVVLDASRTLGAGPWRSFARVALPMARPAIVAGTALALMETVADYGTVAYFGVPTFTVGIYKVWFGMGDRTAATQLAAMLLIFVLAILVIERGSRRGGRTDQESRPFRPLRRYVLRGSRRGLAFAACALPLILGFLIPAGVLLHWSVIGGDQQFGPRFLRLATNSFGLAAVAALVTVAVATALAAGIRMGRGSLIRIAGHIAPLGYAVPGSVIALGILIPLGAVDNALDSLAERLLGVDLGLLLTGGIAALVFAYLVRFLAVALQSVDAGLAKVSPSMDGAARCLGLGPWGVVRRVHLPMAWGSALTAALLVFVEVLKELPATLIMRPFGFDTLAIQAHNLAADERLVEASSAALTIVGVGLIPLILLSRAIARSRPGRDQGA
ncbi:MAG: iron ABC transporter permease [Alphaproteobacteria bacterium]|nr:iron ABC transporter permease [Alphaproteobacteria bacterium]